MNYELAKRLKDAGFLQPQEENGYDGNYYSDPDVVQGSTELVYFPTLEELIEACGKRFTFLNSPYSEVSHEGKWNAHNSYEMYKTPGWEVTNRQGATPTEAVALLWLALNSK